MKNKKLITLVATVSLIALIGVGATLAYFTDKDETLNTITMGHVDIELDEPIFGQENENHTIHNVVPNQSITKDPTITVKGDSESCYLRAKVEIGETLNDTQKEELLKGINIQEENWVLGTDGYYYYQKKVEKTGSDQTVVLFDKVVIPENWGNEIADKEFVINITAEAIQADNFTPTETNGKITGWADSKGTPITAEEYVSK